MLFTSTSGLIGNIGQANYAAAKMGVVGLSRIIAMEGVQKNVRSNIIAPFAWSRMIATIPIKDEASAKRVERMKNHMRADQVAPARDRALRAACKDVTGQIFAARGNEIFLMSQSRPMRGMAKIEGWTPETICNHAFPALKTHDVRRRRHDLGLRLGPDLSQAPSPTTRFPRSASISASRCARRLGDEVERLGAKRVFVATSKTLRRQDRRDLADRNDAWARNASRSSTTSPNIRNSTACSRRRRPRARRRPICSSASAAARSSTA